MWLLNSTISYHGPNAYQLRSFHSYMGDYDLEKDMYFKTQNLIKLLYEWKCKFKKFYSCLIDLSKKMALNRFWEMEEVKSIQNWLDDLTSIGYIEPTITNYEYELSDFNSNDFINKLSNKAKIGQLKFNLRYTPHFETLFDLKTYYGDGQNKMDLIDKQEAFNYFKNYCNTSYNLTLSFDDIIKFPTQNNIILLITFNQEPKKDNVLFLKMFYRSFFRNIIFCGENIRNVMKKNELNLKKFDSFSLIDYGNDIGNINHECMSKVIDMNYKKINGILQISNDVLFKYWNLDFSIFNRIRHIFEPNCLLKLNSDKNALRKILAFIDSATEGTAITDVQTKDALKNMYQKLSANFSDPDCLSEQKIFYLPQNRNHKFKILSEFFTLNKIVSDSAIPIILSGLENLNQENFLRDVKPNKILEFSIKNRKNFCQIVQEKLIMS